MILNLNISFGIAEDFDLDSVDLFSNHGAIMLVLNPENGEIDFANFAAEEFYQYPLEILEGMNINDINVLTMEEVMIEMEDAKNEKRNFFLFKHMLNSGEIRDVEVYSYPVMVNGEEKLFSIIVDVTDKLRVEQLEREHEEHIKNNMITIIYGLIAFFLIFALLFLMLYRKNRQLKYMSKYDALTGVYNRTSISKIYDKLIQKNRLPLAFLMVDVNNLKFINDSFGHIHGDEMIVGVGEKLKSVNGGSNYVARVSGDEFVILIENCNRVRMKEVMEEICKFKVEIESVHFDVSVGSKLVESNKIDYRTAFTISESKMYSIKAHTKAERSAMIEKEMLEKIYEKNSKMKMQGINSPKLAVWIAEKLKLSEEEVEYVKEAARLQGIGHAINIDEYMTRDAISTTDEMNTFRMHPEKGYNILNALGVSQNIANGVFYHHENYDGSGFPKGLVGEEIPIASRIIGLVNGILTEWKLQKNGSLEKIWKSIESNAGIVYDPLIIDKLNYKASLDELKNHLDEIDANTLEMKKHVKK